MHQGPLEAMREIVERVSSRVRQEQSVNAFLGGGTATFLHLSRVRQSLALQARHSDDADIHFEQRLLLHDDIVVRYLDTKKHERVIVLDRTYSIDIGLRHPDCLEDAEYLFTTENGRAHLYVLSPLDLAVTKVGRFQHHDQLDIRLLARAGTLNADSFEKRALEALDNLATSTAMAQIHIDEAVVMIREENRSLGV